MSVMTEQALRDYIYLWLATILTTLWTGTGGTRPAGKVEFVWHMEENSRPLIPILEGRIGMDNRLGRDSISNPVASGPTGYKQTMAGDRECMLYLHWFGTGALDGLKTVRNMVEDPILRPMILRDYFTVVEVHPVIDAHQYLDTKSEDGATLDLRLRYSESWTGDIGIIEHAKIRLEIDGAFLNTITV